LNFFLWTEREHKTLQKEKNSTHKEKVSATRTQIVSSENELDLLKLYSKKHNSEIVAIIVFLQQKKVAEAGLSKMPSKQSSKMERPRDLFSKMCVSSLAESDCSSSIHWTQNSDDELSVCSGSFFQQGEMNATATKWKAAMKNFFGPQTNDCLGINRQNVLVFVPIFFCGHWKVEESKKLKREKVGALLENLQMFLLELLLLYFGFSSNSIMRQ